MLAYTQHFLQRAYDQVVHDVAIQKLPVRFPIDRAGLVGADGPTHAGSYDTSFLGILPGFVVMAPSDEAQLRHMVATAALYDEGPIAFRYPRGEGIGVDLPEIGTTIEIGKGRIIREGTNLALLSFGSRLNIALEAAEELQKSGLSTTVADARFAKPLDHDLIKNLAKNHELLLLIEEGSVGGFGSFVLHFLSQTGMLDQNIKVRSLCFPDYFIEQNTPQNMYAEAGLSAEGIIKTVSEALGKEFTINR